MVLLMLLSGSIVLNIISELAVCRGSGKRDAAVAIAAASMVVLVSSRPFPCEKLGFVCPGIPTAAAHQASTFAHCGNVASEPQDSMMKCTRITVPKTESGTMRLWNVEEGDYGNGLTSGTQILSVCPWPTAGAVGTAE